MYSLYLSLYLLFITKNLGSSTVPDPSDHFTVIFCVLLCDLLPLNKPIVYVYYLLNFFLSHSLSLFLLLDEVNVVRIPNLEGGDERGHSY